MKYTRLEIYKGISNSKIKIIICFFIVIPLIAVLSGSIITRILIPREQLISSNTKVDEPSITSSQNTSYNYKIFFLQAGAFISRNNADVLKNAIKRDDISPVIIQDDEIYRVIINVSDNKSILTEEKDKLQTLGYNCLISEFDFISIDKSDNEEIVKINKCIKICVDMIKLQIQINDSSKLETLKKYNTDLSDSSAELEKINSASDFITFKNNFEQFVNEYIKSNEAGDLNKCHQATGQQILLLNNYYKKVVQKIVK